MVERGKFWRDLKSWVCVSSMMVVVLKLLIELVVLMLLMGICCVLLTRTRLEEILWNCPMVGVLKMGRHSILEIVRHEHEASFETFQDGIPAKLNPVPMSLHFE